jgi:oxygen-independent coproporphyrinogen III oxidase
MKINETLINKYNKPGPRYTSYPPVPFWQNCPTEKEWFKQINQEYLPKNGLDLYVHVPFCERLCYYCGCNRIITKNHQIEDEYLKLIFDEWSTYEKNLPFLPQISSLHIGGGTPTFLTSKNLDELIKRLTLNRTKEFIGSIEVDPRTCTNDHIKVFVENSISRVSLGIQDFHPLVQKSINRIQTPQMIENLMHDLRKNGIESINFDLIYGLPNQTLETIQETIEIVCRMKPDLIAFYSYAHLPERIKNQRLISENDLPNALSKRELYEFGKKMLQDRGYNDIGMDHFALNSNFLFKAAMNKNLKRNFMGYVDKKSNILIGLGPSSISDSGKSFIQNEKIFKKYKDKIQSNQLAIENGHLQEDQEIKIQQIIQNLMCNHEIELDSLGCLPSLERIQNELIEYQKDELLEKTPEGFKLTNLGKVFVRNIAMSFDYHLRERQSDRKFSQTI